MIETSEWGGGGGLAMIGSHALLYRSHQTIVFRDKSVKTKSIQT